MFNKLGFWFLACRPKTLTAAVVPVVVATGVATASLGNQPDLIISFLAMLSALSIQIGTNLINDALDFRKGADTKARIGPMRVTQAGLLSYRQVFVGGILAFLTAIIFAVPLVMHSGWVIAAIGLASLFFGYIYTGGPLPLAYIGLGEVFVFIFFGFVATCGVFYLQTGGVNLDSFIAGTQVGCLATVIIAVNNIRDIDGDLVAKKRTLAVRFGKGFAINEIILLAILPFLVNFYWLTKGYIAAFLLPFMALPPAISVARGIGRVINDAVFNNTIGIQYNRLLAIAAFTHFLFGLMLYAGLSLV